MGGGAGAAMTRRPGGGRAAAFRLLRERGRLDSAALDRVPDRDRAVAQELAFGVRRRLFLLDALLRSQLERPLRELPAVIRELLRLGAYDLAMRDHVPPALAVAETVELAGRSPSLRGLVNAVLRRLAEAIEIVHAVELDPDPRVAWTAPGRFLRLRKPFLPDPAAEPDRHFGTVHTLPEGFVRRFRAELPLEWEDLLRALSTPLPLAMRPMRALGFSPRLLAERLRESGCEGVAVRGNVVELRPPGDPARLEVLRNREGWIQDAVAAEVAPFLAPRPGDRVLDLCAPPGGKTIHLAELMEDRGEVVAAYCGTPALARLPENAARAGLAAIRFHDLHRAGDRLPEGPFDAVLVDAPCSNSGVLMKRVDARFRLDPEEIARLGEVQSRLLDLAAPLLRQDGVLVYATCSILPRENQRVVRAFLGRHPGFLLEEERQRYPHRTRRDGGYMARLRRAASREA
jgi:16S rRNA (cytosine967-C5)-methyltransferase